MWRWYLILGLAGLIALGAVAYLLVCFHRTTPVRRLARRSRPLAWLAAALPLVAVGLVALFNVATLVVVVLHLALIMLLCGLAARLIGRLRRRPVSHDARVIVALALSAAYLGAGVFAAWHVAETHYALTTDKPLPGGALRIVEIADAHLGVTLDGPRFAAQMRRIDALRPDAVVIVGDFVDDDSREADLLAACRALGEMAAPVYYVYGNHDAGYFNQRDFSAARLREALEANGVTILADRAVELDGWTLAGRRDRSTGARLSAAELAAGIDGSRYTVLLDHQPNDFAAEAAAGFDLVLCGHTHGGHIFPLGVFAECLGIDDLRCGHVNRDGADFIVTSGISGWAIPIKTGTWSEFVVVDVRQ